MRSVTFVQRISLEVFGSVAQNAVVLADVNNDGEYELVVGTMEGDLSIYKGVSGEVWKKCPNLGSITAIGVGDLLNKGRNVIVLASGCGWLYIFDLAHCSELDDEIEPTYRQRVPANIRDLIISDINSDGRWQLIVSLTDRVVRMYRWDETMPPDFFFEKRNSREMNYSTSHNVTSSTDVTPIRRQSSQLFGRLLCINKWEFASQIGTVSFNKDSDGNSAVLIGQPGGAFMRLSCKKDDSMPGSQDNDGNDEGCEKSGLRHEGEIKSFEMKENEEHRKETLHYEVHPADEELDGQIPSIIRRRTNPNVSSEILGGFKTGKDGPGTRYAILTLDGSVLLVDDIVGKKTVDNILWNLQVDHQLMCLSKVDITGDGLEEVVCCSWDGETYIISQDKEAVRFQFEEAVSTFTAGNFSLSPSNTQPVLVYVTFSNTIQIYYDLCLGKKDLTLSSLIHYPPMKNEAADILQKLGCEPGNLKQMQEVYSYCLYTMTDL